MNEGGDALPGLTHFQDYAARCAGRLGDVDYARIQDIGFDGEDL